MDELFKWWAVQRSGVPKDYVQSITLLRVLHKSNNVSELRCSGEIIQHWVNDVL